MVLIEAASEPLAGSVRQKAAICSPAWTSSRTFDLIFFLWVNIII